MTAANKFSPVPEPVPYSVRRATHADATGILQCLRAAFETFRESYTPEAFADTVLTPEMLQRRLTTMALFVAVSPAGEIVGTIGYSLGSTVEGHLRGMAVHPHHQGCGVAGGLLQACEAELRERKCLRISLGSTKPLQRAIRFYERNGYRASGKITDFFGMPLFEYVKHLRT